MNNVINIAPPSYVEAMGLPTSTRNNLYVSTSNQPASYDQGSQIPSYPLSTAGPNSYSNIPDQSAYNPAYVSTTLNQQNQPADTLHLANIAVIEQRQKNKKYPTVQVYCATCTGLFLVCSVCAIIILGFTS